MGRDVQKQIDDLNRQYEQNSDAQEQLSGQLHEILDKWSVADVAELTSLPAALARDISNAQQLDQRMDEIEAEQDRIADLSAELEQYRD